MIQIDEKLNCFAQIVIFYLQFESLKLVQKSSKAMG